MTIQIQITREENASYFGVAVGDVVTLPQEDYVAAVVASEVGNAALEAAKAQAVAARTFAYPFYSKNKVITDSSAKHQAYRAARNNVNLYPNAVESAHQTAGQLIAYNGKVISTCSYSASNGGTTTSSQERWGGYRPWQIAQSDPWDAAAGTGKQGHGVGMSQRGAKYAASIGVGYRDILAFYYPGTILIGDTTTEEEKEVEPMGKMIKVADLIETVQIPQKEKWGYIWGESGGVWTEAKQKRATRDMTRKYGSRWIGKRVTDCSGLLSWAFKQLGGTMYHGANTIWNRWCTAQGTLDASTKLKPGSAVFLFDGKKRHHVGLYIGNDTVVEAKGTCYGVVTSNVDHWDEWGELKGVDYTGVTADAMPASYGTATLRKGSRGDSVKRMQQLLVDYGYQIEVDGVFGTNTRRAVEVFQAAHNLAADGICGPKTWDALLTTTATEPDTKVDNEPVKEEQPPTIEERVDALEQAVFGGVKA